MGRDLVFVLIFLICLSFVLAECNEGQIDINTASLEELDEITWVGEATAEKIIAARPFESVDDLVKVSGIGDKKLSDIKSEGLACVEGEEQNSEPEDSENNGEGNEETSESDFEQDTQEDSELTNNEKKAPEREELNLIELDSQNIKTLDEKQENRGRGIYWLVGFCVLLLVLFLIRRNKRPKTEFEE